jgi:misacylated tRNA(Ala) deacylase
MKDQIPLYQQDAYRTHAVAEVISCTPGPVRTADGRTVDAYEVILSDTLLYPGGGGQPPDHGTIAGQPLLGLFRRADGTPVHAMSKPVSGRVEIALDWARRFDHMQQHTAQHLLTAIAKDTYGLFTCAFHLGDERSDIELTELVAGAFSEETLAAIERDANRAIRENHPVTAHIVDQDTFATLPVRTRGLPADHRGPVRLIAIGEPHATITALENENEGEKRDTSKVRARIDLNTCGGTHVRSTGELQMVKLVATQHLSRATRVHYLAGDRVRTQLEISLNHTRALNETLSCGPADHLNAVVKLQAEQKTLRRENRRLTARLANRVGRALIPEDGVIVYHDPNPPAASLDFLRAIANAALDNHPQCLVFCTSGAKEGFFVLTGPPARVQQVRLQVLEAVQGRGGGPPGRCQGKATRLDPKHRKQALKTLKKT